MATGIRTDQARKAMDAAARYRDILGPENFFLEMQYQGIEEQRIVNTCLLYTSDAADERSSVDLGGRRIIKKKKNKVDRSRVPLIKKTDA